MVSGALKLCEAVKESQLPLTSDQTVKFSNYFLSRRSVQSVKGAYSLLNVIGLLSSNKVICISNSSGLTITKRINYVDNINNIRL